MLKLFVWDFIYYIYDICLCLFYSFDINFYRDKKVRFFYEVKFGFVLNFFDGKLNDILRNGLYWFY